MSSSVSLCPPGALIGQTVGGAVALAACGCMIALVTFAIMGNLGFVKVVTLAPGFVFGFPVGMVILLAALAHSGGQYDKEISMWWDAIKSKVWSLLPSGANNIPLPESWHGDIQNIKSDEKV